MLAIGREPRVAELAVVVDEADEAASLAMVLTRSST